MNSHRIQKNEKRRNFIRNYPIRDFRLLFLLCVVHSDVVEYIPCEHTTYSNHAEEIQYSIELDHCYILVDDSVPGHFLTDSGVIPFLQVFMLCEFVSSMAVKHMKLLNLQ